MKNLNTKFTKILSTALLTLLLAGCSDYLDNPLKDKDTGEDINLLVLDFNFFDTRITFKLLDANGGSLINSDATVSFTGKNGNDIIDFAGEKHAEFNTSQGQLELTVDPNVTISETSSFEFAVHVEAPGYNTLSKGFQIRKEGKKTIELKLSKVTDEEETDLDGNIDYSDGDTSIVFSFAPMHNLKSAAVEEKPYKINYEISKNDFLKLKDSNGNNIFTSWPEVVEAHGSDPDNFVTMSIQSYSNYDPEIDVINKNGEAISVLFHKLETGRLKQLVIIGQTVANLNGGVVTSTAEYTGDSTPDIFGFAEFGEENWNMKGTEMVYETLNFSYTLVEASNDILCETGSKITFESDVTSSFSFDADVYDADGNIINTMNFKGSFPESFVLENIPGKAATMVFRNNNPSFEEIPPLEIENLCTGNYSVNVQPTNGYVEYQIVLKALCPDNLTIAIAPTYSAEIKIKGSENPWQGVNMEGGVTNFLGMPDQEYELRLLWQSEWEYSTFYTEFDEHGNYLHEITNDTEISSKFLEDGRVQINVEQIFKQNVCDDMGW